MDNSWEFYSNYNRFVDDLGRDPSPVTDSNGSRTVTNQASGFEGNQTMYFNSAGEHSYPYFTNVVTFKARKDGDRHRDNRNDYLEKRANGFIRPNGKDKICHFCKNNGEPPHVYTSHPMKDKFGRVVCLTLRGFKCPICGATGDDAHTKKYCTLKPLTA